MAISVRILLKQGGITANLNAQNSLRGQALIPAFFYWWLSSQPSLIFNLTVKNCKKLYEFFSIEILSKTLFYPWKKDEMDTTNMALDDKMRAFGMNLVSRFVGFIIRSITIICGLGAITLSFIAGSFASLLFILLPAISIFLLFNSIFIK